jgi:hypothetical protein
VLGDRCDQLALLAGERAPLAISASGVAPGEDAGDRRRGEDATEEQGGAAQRLASANDIVRKSRLGLQPALVGSVFPLLTCAMQAM